MPDTISATARFVATGMPMLTWTKSRMPVATRPRLARLMQLNRMDMFTVFVRMNASMVRPPS